MPRSSSGGRHELGQNFLIHRPTIEQIAAIVSRTSGPILEIGAGDGALTRALARSRRPLTAIDIDEHRVAALRRSLGHVRVVHADAMSYPLDRPVIVGNLPFHLTTPILRRMLRAERWQHAVLLVQWEVARKRAGVGGGTLLTAQSAPWFRFELEGRVPARSFSPAPSVDGGLLAITRREEPLVPAAERRRYEDFAAAVFTGRGANLSASLRRAANLDAAAARRALASAGAGARSLPRDLSPEQWASLWRSCRGGGRAHGVRRRV